ncbi:hypothetical protein [Helicobacter sp. 23-1045]
MAWFIFATALLCLSHYFSLFFIAFAFTFLCYHKKRKNFAPLIVVAISSLLIAQIFYKGYFDFLGGYRAKESMDKLFLSEFSQNLVLSFGVLMEIIKAHFCNIYGFILLCVASLIGMRNLAKAKFGGFLVGFFAVAILWCCFVLFVAPYKELRYVMSVFPILYFGVILVLNAIKVPILRWIFGVCFVASLIANYNVEFLYKKPFLFTQNPNLPVLVHLPSSPFAQGYFLFAFDDMQKIIIERNYTHLWEKTQNLNAFYVISEYPLKAPKGFSQSALHTQSYGYFYLFESKKIINPQTLKNNANFLLKLQF